MSLKDTKTGKVWATTKLQELKGQEYAKAGINLKEPFANQNEYLATRISTELSDEQCDLILKLISIEK